MKKNVVKRVLAVAMATAMSVGLLAGCGSGSKDSTGSSSNVSEGVGGTIMWLSNLTEGVQYESTVAYLNALCEAAGYDELLVVYGDSMNDPTGNLTQVQNSMTDDVKGLIVSQDGGIADIMAQYPDLYVCGYNTDMQSVYSSNPETATNASLLDNDHFLGSIADQSADGEGIAQRYLDVCIEKGYQKVAVVNFPGFAYPALDVAAASFTEKVDEYNKTADADKQIEICGDTTTLMFSPIEDSWFSEKDHQDLDAIVGMCAGTMFIYPGLKTAQANGTCPEKTQLITSGFENDADLLADIGDGKAIGFVSVSPAEDPLFAFALLDNAINGKQYSDWTNELQDSADFSIYNQDDVDKVMSKSLLGTGDAADALISVDDAMNLLVRNNDKATMKDLMDALYTCKVENIK